MDTGSEERERGVTVDIAQFLFSTDKVDFTILDAPGHRDFVPNMIGGASMADTAVLVVDANQLESGMKGQTKEHILLAQACGVKKIIVAVNKLDSTMPAWNESFFKHVRDEVSKLLNGSQFKPDEVAFVPCSGLNGQNVVKPMEKDPETAWVTGHFPTLLEALERYTSNEATDDVVRRPLRMQISDVFRGGVTNPLSVSGRMTAGNVQVGDSVLVQPSGEAAVIRGIEVGGDGKDWAVAGQICNLHLTDIDAQYLRAGDMLCSSSKPVSVVQSFVASVRAIDSLLPQAVDVHVGRLHVPGSISAIISTVDAKGAMVKKKPRVVKAEQQANVKITLDAGAPLEAGDVVILRANGSTVAAGKIERVGG